MVGNQRCLHYLWYSSHFSLQSFQFVFVGSPGPDKDPAAAAEVGSSVRRVLSSDILSARDLGLLLERHTHQ